MRDAEAVPEILVRLVGYGDGAGMGLMFLLAGAAGIVVCILVSRNPGIRGLEDENQEKKGMKALENLPPRKPYSYFPIPPHIFLKEKM